MKKTACFIDAGYLNNILKNFYNVSKIDHCKLSNELCPKQELLRTYYYDCKCYMSDPPTQEERERQANQDKFWKRLMLLPQFECRFGRLEKRIDPVNQTPFFEQKRVDVLFAVDLVSLSSKHLITDAVLITGDSDMIPAIQIAKNEGIIVTLYYMPGATTHHELLETVDIAIPIDQAFIKRIAISQTSSSMQHPAGNNNISIEKPNVPNKKANVRFEKSTVQAEKSNLRQVKPKVRVEKETVVRDEKTKVRSRNPRRRPTQSTSKPPAAANPKEPLRGK